MPSDERAFQGALKRCEKAFVGMPLRVVIGVLEQLLVESLGQVPEKSRARAMQVVFDAIQMRVLAPDVPRASNLGHKGGTVGGGSSRLIVPPFQAR